jgi:hypothetical protein
MGRHPIADEPATQAQRRPTTMSTTPPQITACPHCGTAPADADGYAGDYCRGYALRPHTYVDPAIAQQRKRARRALGLED